MSVRNSTYIRTLGFMIATLVAVSACHLAHSQSITVGSDFVSRYVWRGVDFGESASIQPSIVLTHGRFEASSWASYSLQPDGASANELDLSVALALYQGGLGTVTVGATDYYFPAPDAAPLFDFSGGGNGSHSVESFVRLDGPDSVPVSLFGSVFVHNDPDKSAYLEASSSVDVESTEIGFVVGAVLTASDFYATTGFRFVNVGIAATKAITVSDEFAIPIRVALTANPDQERLFLVVGFSIVV